MATRIGASLPLYRTVIKGGCCPVGIIGGMARAAILHGYYVVNTFPGCNGTIMAILTGKNYLGMIYNRRHKGTTCYVACGAIIGYLRVQGI